MIAVANDSLQIPIFWYSYLTLKTKCHRKMLCFRKKKEKTKNPTQKNPKHHFFLKEQQ